MAGDWTGGCACGAVRYRLASDPFDAGCCHCRTCQLNSGSPAMAFASVAADFSIATLDEPDRIVPDFHIFYKSRIPWAEAADDAPRHARFRAETRGLNPGEDP